MSSGIDKLIKACNREDHICPDNIDTEACESIDCSECRDISEKIENERG